ncbi:hypothetical protein [Streptomyces sp. A1499]|uniref:hypothetical protein n=1 Tax=Streptomyces sp. A1499 TaxID=2563104 RepID=UPI00109E8E9C|nr:hypothetical protein [Streptomyces sp. A1499]THC40308.1 hypothetical protein E7X58_37780 [Streptomyces sp. A1499]
MHTRASRYVSLLTGLALFAAALWGVSGCGGSQKGADGGTDVLTVRARQVAAAWDGSTAAAAWRAGYYPMGETVQLPRGGLHGRADQQAYEDQNFVLRGTLPGAGPKDGQVTWAGGTSLTRPLVGALESYKTLAGTRVGRKPHLTVTGAKLGEMRVATSRGPATVPAWLFTLDGYASPFKQAAVLPSKLPQPPIRSSRGVPGYPINRLVGIAADGRSVTVVALHGVCDEGAVVDVLESKGSIVLSASVKNQKHDSNCIKQAKMQRVTVQLERSVGDRVLLDARTGQPVTYKGLRGTSPSRS